MTNTFVEYFGGPGGKVWVGSGRNSSLYPQKHFKLQCNASVWMVPTWEAFEVHS